uniref:Uncharacterized protein n=1 Tax=Anguilla anguilla TaxID=7936 RepID=A0A0E9SF69_ANGAN
MIALPTGLLAEPKHELCELATGLILSKCSRISKLFDTCENMKTFKVSVFSITW